MIGHSGKAWVVPEVLQTSLMDCGPAALKAVLEGFGVSVPYDSIRERCATDVDGTSIAALARLGSALGLETHQMLLPADCLLFREAKALPAIAVTRAASGLLHFIVVWSTCGHWVQIMDPGAGRRWVHRQELLTALPSIEAPISSSRWRRWTSSPAGTTLLAARLRAAGVTGRRAASLLERADADPTWSTFARLDAAVRMLGELAGTGTRLRGDRAARFLASLLEPDGAAGAEQQTLPARYFWAVGDAPADRTITLHGCVIVHVARKLATRDAHPAKPSAARSVRAGYADPPAAPPAIQRDEANGPRELGALSRRLRAALHASEARPMRWLWRCVREDSRGMLGLLVLALASLALVVPAEAVMLRAMIGAQPALGLTYQRLGGVALVTTLILSTLALEYWIAAAARTLGRRLEVRLRAALLEKLPRLEDHYLRSRPVSDMAARGQSLHLLREVPALWIDAARALVTLVAIGAALIWLDPPSTPLVAALIAVSLVVPLATSRGLAESHMRLRTQGCALERFYLDALLGVHPIRVHGAERIMQIEYEALLTDWARTARSLHAQTIVLQGFQLFTATALVLLLLGRYVAEGGPLGAIVLFALWSFRLPGAAQTLVSTQLALRQVHGVALRLLAPLSAAESSPAGAPNRAAAARSGVRIELEHVHVRMSGHPLLADLQLEIAAGSHIAVVGASGSGKSSLLGLLLGWTSPSTGEIKLDGDRLDGPRLAQLREETAWVDPAVHVWSRSIYDNVEFGRDSGSSGRVPEAMAQAGVLELLDRLPDGADEQLGEGGVRLSGGESQRVRLARAFLRKSARLVLLDEPFRGLERSRRHQLLRDMRAHWAGATLLFASHDLEDSLDFDRVLVMEAGRVVESGEPARLLSQPGSRYAALVEADRVLKAELWSRAAWTRYALKDGRIARGASRD